MKKPSVVETGGWLLIYRSGITITEFVHVPSVCYGIIYEANRIFRTAMKLVRCFRRDKRTVVVDIKVESNEIIISPLVDTAYYSANSERNEPGLQFPLQICLFQY